MKKITLILFTAIVWTGLVLTIDKVAANPESSKFDISPKSSKKIYYNWGKGCEIKISAKANYGKVHLAVFNPKGEKIVSGKGRVQVKTGNKKGRYKLVLENRTNRKVKVVLNNVSKLCHDTAMA